MISRVHSAILQGIDAIGCEVEADVAHGGRPFDPDPSGLLSTSSRSATGQAGVKKCDV
jgi:hypothetical protein